MLRVSILAPPTISQAWLDERQSNQLAAAIGLAPTTCAFLAEHAPRPSHLLQQHSDSCCSAAGSFSCAVSSCFQQILRICTPATSEQQCSDCKAVRSLCHLLATPCASAALCSLAFAGIGPSLRSRQRHDR